MGTAGPSNRINSFAALRELARQAEPSERCDFCHAGIAEDHRHLLNIETSRLICACQPCALLFSAETSSKYKTVPRRVKVLNDFQLNDIEWDRLQIPINLAFFFTSTKAGRVVVIYPSPAGPTESLLDLGLDLESQNNSIFQQLEPDVEGLLVNRVADQRQYFIVPIDACYELVGVIRSHWHGLSGGKEMWREVDRFFTHLNERAVGFR